MNILHISFLLTLLLSGCGEIKNSSRITQEKKESHVAGVGDAIIEIDTRESLPNAFGKADMFGRTRPTGKIIVSYLGLEQGRAVFERINIRMQSNATTLNSTPLIIPQTSTTYYSGTSNYAGMMPGGNFSGSGVSSGTATTTVPPLVLPPTGSETRIISNDHMRYYVDLSSERSIVVDGNRIVIDDATASSVRYRIFTQDNSHQYEHVSG